jgi:hypothetical protein
VPTTVRCWTASPMVRHLARSLATRIQLPPAHNRHSTWPEGFLHYVYLTRSPLQNSSTPTVVGSTVDMVHFSVLIRCAMSKTLVLYSVHSLLSDLEVVDQPCHKCPRLSVAIICYLWLPWDWAHKIVLSFIEDGGQKVNSIITAKISHHSQVQSIYRENANHTF